MTKDTDNLIRELLLLYVKYGPVTFGKATDMFSRGVVSSTIAEGAREVSNLAQANKRETSAHPEENRRHRRPTPSESLEGYMADLFSSGKENAALVGRFVDEVANRRVLATSSLLRDYVETLGLSPPSAHADRYTNAKRIGDFLLTLPAKEAEEKINAGRNMTQAKSSLAAWTNIIVKPGFDR